MEFLQKTQFAHKQMQLHPFLAKKMEEAIAKAYLKKQASPNALEEKLAKAERHRQE